MRRERILSLLGYDPALLHELSDEQRSSLRGGAVVWLVACLVLGLATAYAGWTVQPTVWAAGVGGFAGTLLPLNLLRVVTAGGGATLGTTPQQSRDACDRYRPSPVPALVFAVLAAILAQPAQLPFWPEIDPQVEAHRQQMLIDHDKASRLLGTDPGYYRRELETAGFPIFRLKLVWQNPRRALRLTSIMFLLVLLPAFWSRVISIRSVRAYEWLRCRRAHRSAKELHRECEAQIADLLRQWPTYHPQHNWPGDRGPSNRDPWLTRSPS